MTETPTDPREPRRVAAPLSMVARLRDIEPIEVDERTETREEAAARIAKAHESRVRMWQARVPLRFKTARLSDLAPEQDPTGQIASWWNSEALNLLLWSGNTGVGKTHAAYAIGNAAVHEHGAWAAAWTATALNDALRPGQDETALDVARACDLLVLDDLGSERLTEWTIERLLLVLDDRAGNGRRSVFTTNLTGDQILDHYGDRVLDRLGDRAWVVQMQGDTRRRRAPW